MALLQWKAESQTAFSASFNGRELYLEQDPKTHNWNLFCNQQKVTGSPFPTSKDARAFAETAANNVFKELRMNNPQARVNKPVMKQPQRMANVVVPINPLKVKAKHAVFNREEHRKDKGEVKLKPTRTKFKPKSRADVGRSQHTPA